MWRSYLFELSTDEYLGSISEKRNAKPPRCGVGAGLQALHSYYYCYYNNNNNNIEREDLFNEFVLTWFVASANEFKLSVYERFDIDLDLAARLRVLTKLISVQHTDETVTEFTITCYNCEFRRYPIENAGPQGAENSARYFHPYPVYTQFPRNRVAGQPTHSLIFPYTFPLTLLLVVSPT